MSISWGGVFGFGVHPLEIAIRGTIMYLGLYVLLHFVLKRGTTELSFNDVLVLVLLADAAQNGMAGQYTSISDGILLVAVILFWSYALAWLSYHNRWFGERVHPRPKPIVEHGRLIQENLGGELVTLEELMTELRMEGISTLRDVEHAYFEGNGQISVVRRGADGRSGSDRSTGTSD